MGEAADSNKILEQAGPWTIEQRKQTENEHRDNAGGFGHSESSWVEVACSFSGMDDGVADRVDQTSAVGNGQVPIVAVRAWEILSGEHEKRLP